MNSCASDQDAERDFFHDVFISIPSSDFKIIFGFLTTKKFQQSSHLHGIQ